MLFRSGWFVGDDSSIFFTDEYLHHLEFAITPNVRLPLMSTDEDVPQVGITDQMALNLNILEQDPESLDLLDDLNNNMSKPQKDHGVI